MALDTQNEIPLLLVDDRAENLLALEQLLCNRGYELVRAFSGNEALRLALKRDFALVLMDVQMPEMDGFETAELMRANSKTRHIPIIFVTAGMKDLQFQFKGYDAGAVDYLAKPIEPIILQSKIRVFTELYSQRKELEQHKKYLQKMVEQKTAELALSNCLLESRNHALQEKISEFIETHDQLLATEEMLRVQIEEYETGQLLLNESNRNLQMLFDLSPLAIVISTSGEGIILETNRTFTDLFGYDKDSVTGKSWNELNVWPDNNVCREFMDSIANQQALSGFSATICNQQQENRNVLIYDNYINYKGKPCLLAVILDVTEQKRLETQLRQTQKMEVIGQLAGGVAHDFNNMLSAIIGSSEMLMRHVQDNPRALKFVSTINDAAMRSADLTKQLLYFSRKGHGVYTELCVSDTIRSTISLLERSLDKSILIQLNLAAANTVVNGDQSQIQNALLNLGVNARDALPDGGTITFNTANVVLDATSCDLNNVRVTPGEYIEISVTDTGIGMTKDIVDHIFEPFFTTKAVGKGTGLGLAAVFGTIREHKGSISVVSEPGVGTTFKLYLPLSSSSCVTVAEQESVHAHHGTGGVLLVDDEEMLRVIGKDILESLGYQVYLAEDGIQALELYARERGNIVFILLDMVMPNMGGKETLQRFLELYPDARILVASGFHREGTSEDLIELGAKGFIQKPYNRNSLCQAIQNM